MRSVLVELPTQQLPCVVNTALGTTEGYWDGRLWWIPVKGPDKIFTDAQEWEYMTPETVVQPNESAVTLQL